MARTAREQLARDIDTVEEAYEFFLAYAAQGLRESAKGSEVEGRFRRHLDAMHQAVGSLAGALGALLEEEDVASPAQLQAFGKVVESDAASTVAALELVRAQPFASSQLVDNLNASVHLRALLTDLFLLDEVLALDVARPEALSAAGEPHPDPGAGG